MKMDQSLAFGEHGSAFESHTYQGASVPNTVSEKAHATYGIDTLKGFGILEAL
jgi:hypothetical protein